MIQSNGRRRHVPHAVLVVLGAFFVALAAAAALVGVLPADAAVREALLSWASDRKSTRLNSSH